MMHKLLNIDRRIVFVAVAIVILAGMALDTVVPLPASAEAQSVFDAVEATGAGDTILVAMDYPPSSASELDPMSRAALHHAFARDATVLVVSFDSGGAPRAAKMVDAVAAELGKVNGVDYAVLGYKPDMTAALIEMGTDIAGVFTEVTIDGEPVPTESVEAMQGVANYSDIALAVQMTGSKKYEEWVEYANARFGLKLVTGATGSVVTGQYPYLASGQISGLLRSTRGASDYETMVIDAYGHDDSGLEPDASKKMSVLFMGHLLILLFIGIANVGHWATRGGAKETA
jgi:hypothetical protein